MGAVSRALTAFVFALVAVLSSASPAWACLCQANKPPAKSCCPEKHRQQPADHAVGTQPANCCCSVALHRGPAAPPESVADATGVPAASPAWMVTRVDIGAVPAAGRAVASGTRSTGPPSQAALLAPVRLRP